MEFDHFNFEKSFSADDFEMKRNLTSMDLQNLVPAMAEEGKQEQQTTAQSFGVIEPGYLPEGVQKHDMQQVNVGGEEGVLLRYTGTYNYSIVETRPEEYTVIAAQADLIDLGLDLGYTYGVLSGNKMKTLRWVHEGVEYRLSSEDLPEQEMIQIAQSVQGTSGK